MKFSRMDQYRFRSHTSAIITVPSFLDCFPQGMKEVYMREKKGIRLFPIRVIPYKFNYIFAKNII